MMKQKYIYALLAILVLALVSGCGLRDLWNQETAPTKEPVQVVQEVPKKPVITETTGTEVPKGVPVLMYHMVGPDEDNDAVIREDLFRAQMKLLKEKGFHPISMQQLYDYMTAGKGLPPKPVVLNFDDGYKDTYTIVYPIMKEYNFPFTVYVNPGDVGTRLTWDELKEMSEGGATISNHGYDHVRMRELTPEQQKANIVKAQEALQEKLGRINTWFCYPYGSVTADTPAIAKDAGILLGVTMNPGWTHVGDDPYAVHRIWIGNAVDLEHFEERITTEQYRDL